MDDPWGSPWAQTNEKATHSTNFPSSPTAELGDLGLEPPPRVLLTTNNSGSAVSSQLSLSSPWQKDEDGFGDWASAEPANLTPSGLNPWASWGDPNQPPQQQPTPQRGRSTTKDSLSAWPSSTASSPALRPLPHVRTSISRSPTLSRQPSFDPWKSDLSLKAPNDVFTADHLARSRAASDALKADVALQNPAEPENFLANGPQQLDWGGMTASESVENSKQEEPRLDVPGKGDSAEQDHSRPSSRSSNSSAREECSRDSPVTSVGEDERDGTGDAKSASKVQELVNMFNGLSKQPEDAEQTVAEPCSRADGDTGDGNFGDFEKVHEDNNDSTSRINASPLATPLASQKAAATGDCTDEPHAPADWEAAQRQKDRVPVHIPMDKLDELFPSPNENREQMKGHKREESFSRVIYDSFTEDSERKAWYRISRFGSMLRNDAADFENYLSVAWEDTKVHAETLVVVKRWMQDASLVTDSSLDGGGLGAVRSGRIGGFGWDSAVPTVSMADIFGPKRRGLRAHHGASSSEGHIVQSQNMRPLGSQVDTPTTKSPLSPSTAAFGWSTVATSGAQSEGEGRNEDQQSNPIQRRPLSLHQPRDILHQKQGSSIQAGSTLSSPLSSSGSHTSGAPLSTAPLQTAPALPSNPSSPSLPKVPTIPAPLEICSPSTNTASRSYPISTAISPSTNMQEKDGSEDENNGDEDEWGEMVSSPTIGSTPIVAFSADIPTQPSPSTNVSSVPTLESPQPTKAVALTYPTSANFSTAQDSLPLGGAHITLAATTLSEEEEKLVSNIVASLPNLSWMMVP